LLRRGESKITKPRRSTNNGQERSAAEPRCSRAIGPNRLVDIVRPPRRRQSTGEQRAADPPLLCQKKTCCASRFGIANETQPRPGDAPRSCASRAFISMMGDVRRQTRRRTAPIAVARVRSHPHEIDAAVRLRQGMRRGVSGLLLLVVQSRLIRRRHPPDCRIL